MADIAATSDGDTPAPLRTVDKRTRLVRVFRQTQREVTQALGGSDYVTPQQVIAVRQLAQAGALRESVFARIAAGEDAPLEQFTALAATETRTLKLLGLSRRARRAQTLAA